MSQKYRHVIGSEVIENLCLQTLNYGIKMGFNVNDIKIYLHPRIMKMLKLNDFLLVKIGDDEYSISIVPDKSITEQKTDDGYQSIVYMGDPEWPQYNETRYEPRM